MVEYGECVCPSGFGLSQNVNSIKILHVQFFGGHKRSFSNLSVFVCMDGCFRVYMYVCVCCNDPPTVSDSRPGGRQRD